MTMSGEHAVNQASAFAGGARIIKTPVALSARKIYISASIGIASGVPTQCSSTELFRRADMAMYHAKKAVREERPV